MGNGNNMNYVEVRIGTCTGESGLLTFDNESFRESRSQANQAWGELFTVAISGKDVNGFKKNARVYEWIKGFEPTAHITSLAVVKVNRESHSEKVFADREYPCVHDKEPA
jgi:hypothetical protein